MYNFLQINETLSTSGMPKPDQIKDIATSGVKFVINLATSKSEDWIPNEAELVTNSGMNYLSIPVDWENPTRKNLDDFMNAMDKYRNERVHVHCQANFRASAFVSLYQVLHLNLDKEIAFQNISKIWKPDEYPVWKKFIEDNLSKP
ncbi:MAG: protein tyrosine phosphatase family protein [Anaerolineales bacterium]